MLKNWIFVQNSRLAEIGLAKAKAIDISKAVRVVFVWILGSSVLRHGVLFIHFPSPSFFDRPFYIGQVIGYCRVVLIRAIRWATDIPSFMDFRFQYQDGQQAV